MSNAAAQNINEQTPAAAEGGAPAVALPLVQPDQGWKRRAKAALGGVACHFMHQRAVDLTRCRGDGYYGFVDRLMLSALLERAERKGTLEQFTHRQQQHFWATPAAAAYHADVEFRFRELFLGENASFVDELDTLIAQRQPAAICEIGCGSGQVIDHLARKHPNVARCVGIDLSATQIARNAERFDAPSLEWVAGDAVRWLDRHATSNWAVISNNGVFEYFLRSDLERLFASIAQRRPSILALLEPMDPDHDLDRDPESRPYGSERSFSHNYLALLRGAGFRIVHRSELVQHPHRLVRLIAVTDTATTGDD